MPISGCTWANLGVPNSYARANPCVSCLLRFSLLLFSLHLLLLLVALVVRSARRPSSIRAKRGEQQAPRGLFSNIRKAYYIGQETSHRNSA